MGWGQPRPQISSSRCSVVAFVRARLRGIGQFAQGELNVRHEGVLDNIETEAGRAVQQIKIVLRSAE